ncbi:hypothetical protein SLEP1_g15659 [Rubroshorea leprosula]|uniref:Uncharacterized protein n=1 Tax=Rubroshorea leprosula TaxID=152421 RepID=A0AAV5IZS6_9ROSI|nr:hypothetical protein SLEP1_g15659 [Rubroshorea leprosula]
MFFALFDPMFDLSEFYGRRFTHSVKFMNFIGSVADLCFGS